MNVEDEIRQWHSKRRPKIVRMSISLSPDLAKYVRDKAAETGVPVSAIVEYALKLYKGDFSG